MRMNGIARLTIVLAVTASTTVAAQWARHQVPGVPRDDTGQVRMDAPTPRMPNGKPDFSGNWVRFRGEGGGAGRGRGRGAAVPPADPNSPPVATFFELGANMPGGLPFTPWAAQLRKEREAANSKDNPDALCLPMGITQFHMHGQPRKLLHTPTVLTLIYEANYGLRFIYTDGRELPPQGAPQPWWYGYSVGRWEGDELVVETNNLRDDGWLDVRGSPLTDQARIVEWFRRPNYGKLEIDITITDPKAYTRPFTVRVNQQISPDDEIIEFICNENQQFRTRIKID
jgi:hypothetical protein